MDELTRRCTATNRSGQQCGRSPIPGGYVCVMHGGGAPAVQQSAKARLLAGADLAIDYLLNLLTPRPPCETCGRSDADRDPVVVRACQLVLDRSGFHPTLTVEQAAPRHNEFENYTEDQMIEHTEALLKRMIESRDFHREHDISRLLPVADARVIDAVIDDGFEVPEDDATYDTLSSAAPEQSTQSEHSAPDAPLEVVSGPSDHLPVDISPPIQEPAVPFPLGKVTPDESKDTK